MTKCIIGIDTGGTFTDFVLLRDGEVITHKVLSTPDSPERAILKGLDELGLANSPIDMIHGSTVATNAALEGKGVKTLYIANVGLEDVLSIGRQQRRSLYSLAPTPRAKPVPSECCVGVAARTAADGCDIQVLQAKDFELLNRYLKHERPSAVAINLVFSFVNDQQELALEEWLNQHWPQLFVSRSSKVLPEYREYERGIATWLNACLGPLMQGYLLRLEQGVKQLHPNYTMAMMQSSGETLDIAQAAEQSVRLLLSGPAGGVAAVNYLACELGEERLLSFDMGGTSTDVAVYNQGIGLTTEGRIGEYPVAVPMVDMHTIGAGGGSIGHVDDGGCLRVGPGSAGAMPGPACYGKGGELPTVTDANLFLGYLPHFTLLAGGMPVNLEGAERALTELASQLEVSAEEAASGILELANENMAAALRVMSVERGLLPSTFTLVCFGGAGGLHLCALAEKLGMSKAIIPQFGGVLSAFGMLVAPKGGQWSRSWCRTLSSCDSSAIATLFADIEQQIIRERGERALDGAEMIRSVDCRYSGQTSTITLPFESFEKLSIAFHARHKYQFGHQLAVDIEIVTLRVQLNQPASPVSLPCAEKQSDIIILGRQKLVGEGAEVDVIKRSSMFSGYTARGPLIIAEDTTTHFVKPGWCVKVLNSGHLSLDRVEPSPAT